MTRRTWTVLLLIVATIISLWMIVAAGSWLYPAAAEAPTIRPIAPEQRAYQNPIVVLLTQVAVILIFCRALGYVCQWLRQPLVIGEMAAGILLGPSLLGWVAPGVSAALFPVESIEYLRVLSQVGVILFLFLIGLELDPRLLRDRGQAAALIGMASIAVPFVLGAALTLYLYPRFFGGTSGSDFASVALFMGAAMSVTALPVLARLLAERNLHQTTAGAVAITCAAIGDAAAWCILAVVVGIARAEGVTQGLVIAGQAVVYVLAMFLIVRPLLRRLQRLHDVRGGLSQAVMALIFVLVLLSAWVTERIGVHALFGAFMMGAIMPKGTQFVRNLLEKLEDFTVVFLLPVFFVYAGLQTQIGLLNEEPRLWADATLIILVACVGKFGGTAVAGLAAGLSRRDSTTLGVLMNTRGLMELVILQIGLQEGILTPTVFAMMVIMALVTTAMTAPLLDLLMPKATRETVRGADGPTILAPVAAADSGPALVRFAAGLLGTVPRPPTGEVAGSPTDPPPAAPRGKLLAMHLVRPDDDQFGAGLSDLHASSDAALHPVVATAQALRLPTETISFASNDIAADIASVANTRGVWLLLMGFHRPVFGTEILGGLVHRVLQSARCDVAVFVDRGFNAARRVLVPYRGGPSDRAALELAERLNRHSGALVTILHIVPALRDAPRLDAKGAVDAAFADPGSRAGVTLQVVMHDDPLSATLAAAKGYDLVIVAADEAWGLESQYFGFRPQRLADECQTSLLIVRRPGK